MQDHRHKNFRNNATTPSRTPALRPVLHALGAVLLLAGLSGCAPYSQGYNTAGSAAGAAIGGILGSGIGDGRGRIAATALGAGTGAVLGSGCPSVSSGQIAGGVLGAIAGAGISHDKSNDRRALYTGTATAAGAIMGGAINSGNNGRCQ